jgi:hypothetical protein
MDKLTEQELEFLRAEAKGARLLKNHCKPLTRKSFSPRLKRPRRRPKETVFS